MNFKTGNETDGRVVERIHSHSFACGSSSSHELRNSRTRSRAESRAATSPPKLGSEPLALHGLLLPAEASNEILDHACGAANDQQWDCGVGIGTRSETVSSKRSCSRTDDRRSKSGELCDPERPPSIGNTFSLPGSFNPGCRLLALVFPKANGHVEPGCP